MSRNWNDDYWLDEGNTRSMVVLEEDRSPTKTGLVDARGQDIYRIPARFPIGFQPPPADTRMIHYPLGEPLQELRAACPCEDKGLPPKTVKVRKGKGKGKK